MTDTFDKAFCLQAELDELVTAILNAKDLEDLKRVVLLNFPQEEPDTYIFNYSAKPLDMKLEIKYSDGTSERFPLHHEQYTVKSGVDVVSYGIVTQSVMVRKDRQKEHKKKTLIEWIKAKEPDYIFDEGCAYLVKLISEYLDRK